MIAQFALRLICGMSLMWALMPRRQVSSGFFRIQMLVAMGLGVLAALSRAMDAQAAIDAAGKTALATALPTPFFVSLPAGLIAVLGFVGSALWTLERRTGAARVGFGVLAVSAALIVIPYDGAGHDLRAIDVTDTVVEFDPPTVSSAWLAIASEFAGAGVLGGAVVGMLLGHWYLTAPAMSIDPLKRLNQFLGIAGVLRLLVSIAVVMMLSAGMLDTAETPARLAAVPKAWFSLRWFAGVIGPLVVSFMVWRILKYRNTQAATGVLFVGVILAFIGDMTAALLLKETGLPM